MSTEASELLRSAATLYLTFLLIIFISLARYLLKTHRENSSVDLIDSFNRQKKSEKEHP